MSMSSGSGLINQRDEDRENECEKECKEEFQEGGRGVTS